MRDLLLGRACADRDYLVLGAAPGEFLRRFPRAMQVGKAFPVYLADGEEFAFPRTEGCPTCCCAFGDGDLLNDLAADLRARDFTVNALALPLPDFPALPTREAAWDLAVGLPSSMDDLRAGVLRPAGPKSLARDPLRVFRAARFAAQLPEFDVHEDLRAAMREACARGLTDDLAPERVGAELRKALAAPAPGRFLRLLAETGCLRPWFAEFQEADHIPAGPPEHHDASVLEHTARLMDALAGDELVCWMALTHDLGKTATPATEHPAHHGHDRLGEPLALALGERLALPARHIRAGALAARLHMAAARYPELRPGTRVDLLAETHAARLTDELFRMTAADCGRDHAPRARADLTAMLAVRLPEEWRDRGEESGRRLRDLRCMALADEDRSRRG